MYGIEIIVETEKGRVYFWLETDSAEAFARLEEFGNRVNGIEEYILIGELCASFPIRVQVEDSEPEETTVQPRKERPVAKAKKVAAPVSVDEFKSKLATDARWVARGIVALYQRQTADEKSDGATKHQNGAGFNGTDALILSSFAQQIQRGRTLSEKQLAIAFRKMPKYARQLHRIAYG